MMIVTAADRRRSSLHLFARFQALVQSWVAPIFAGGRGGVIPIPKPLTRRQLKLARRRALRFEPSPWQMIADLRDWKRRNYQPACVEWLPRR